MHWALRPIISCFVAISTVFREPAVAQAEEVIDSPPVRRNVTHTRGSAGVTSMKRGVGYCENTDCAQFCKGVFLLNHEGGFLCAGCREPGRAMPESGYAINGGDTFKEVRVEYNFDPVNNKYREIAIVRDESLWGDCNTYVLQSPLIKTERRALKVAEAILANITRYHGLNNPKEIPRTTEIVISFDDPFEEFAKTLEDLSAIWLKSRQPEPSPPKEQVTQ